LSWHPAGANSPFTLALGDFFASIFIED